MNFDNPLELSDTVINDIRNHARLEWPKECCGLIVDRQFVPCENESPDPENSFSIDPDCWIECDNLGVEAVIHSHCMTKHAPEPSSVDMQLQISTDVPWAIVMASKDWASKPIWWGDFRLDQPLVGRPFIHGILDCYSLVRAYYWQNHKVILPDFSRNNHWWLGDEDLYVQNFKKAGFHEVAKDDIRVGDGVLISLKGHKTHHAGIILEGGLFLHHLQQKVSCIDTLHRWDRFSTHHARYYA